MLQITLGDIRHMHRIVDQNVIPGAILGGPPFGHFRVPLLAHIKLRVHVHDNPSVVEFLVVDDFAHPKGSSTFRHPLGISDRPDFVNLESE